ncbi:hypothetical protein AB0F91_43030 [Amycolatopsis sp. NPDC023774]|uniref:hypothetical protein n=1 Tax=Amycolatopsis sp. NPDC023774 TaxID=3155015 RepID=UPI0033C64DEB
MGSASPGAAVVVEPFFVVFWHPDGTTPVGPGEPGTVDVVLRDGLRTVPARRVLIADAIELLPGVCGDASAEFWSVAAQAGTRLAEAGWTGPLAPEEEQWLRRLADAMPPHAHATPLPGDPARLPEPFPLLLRFLRDVAGLAAATRVSLRLERSRRLLRPCFDTPNLGADRREEVPEFDRAVQRPLLAPAVLPPQVVVQGQGVEHVGLPAPRGRCGPSKRRRYSRTLAASSGIRSKYGSSTFACRREIGRSPDLPRLRTVKDVPHN